MSTKNITSIILLFALIVLLSSCGLNDLDNYDQPDAGLSGRIVDDETGELVQQDIIRGGVIEIVENGYVTPQYLVLKNDGTYANTRLFANSYTVQPKRGNFKVVDPQEVNVKGQTTLDFRVTPYIRIKDLDIEKDGNIIRATFRLEQTSVSNVLKVGLYAHPDPNVGEPMHLARKEVNVNEIVDPNEVFQIELDTFSDPDLREGKLIFFRVGALIDVPEAKFNYAAAVSIKL
ncbi:DUF3823 domain-containing protein [Pseudochryseolinea flava]|uniref:DUF3823 domain-containing protein n=1 Tax=Pseudochryseolinea flava TaxID=2059302 RepID=A0A364XXR1_9BACT|nr:DUF3823 domain-containing protein [Pseudochryseolinea flava]RAV98204.1 hypothetical protein DQQ10_24680 [Pseudochryseolinea flava]